MTNFLTAQSDDRELLEWLANANQRGGGFVSAIARAGLMADAENYRILRPVLLEMRAKHPAYEPSDAVKQEIKGSQPVICIFCHADFDRAADRGLLLIRCAQHDSPICPECFCCQAAAPLFPFSIPARTDREMRRQTQRWGDAT